MTPAFLNCSAAAAPPWHSGDPSRQRIARARPLRERSVSGSTCQRTTKEILLGGHDDSFVAGSGMVPVFSQRLVSAPDLSDGNGMKLVSTREATRLTGLSTDRLREWTSRRAIIPADVRPKGHGSPAQFTWQTILVIRLAAALRARFRVELHAHRPLFASLRRGFHGVSFIALWDKRLAIHSSSRWLLLDASSVPPEPQDAIVLCLAPHLEILSTGFALPLPSVADGQLDLFPAHGLPANSPVPRAVPAVPTSPAVAPGRRQATA